MHRNYAYAACDGVQVAGCCIAVAFAVVFVIAASTVTEIIVVVVY